MLIAIIIVISCIVIAIGFGVFFLIKLITHFKETEIRNKIIFRLAAVIILTIILGGVNAFLIVKYSLDKLGSGIDNISLPIISENTYKPISEIPNAVIIGRIDTDFYIKVAGDSKIARQQIDRMAYIELLRAAEGKYGSGDDIDVADITWVFNETESDILVTEPVEYSAIGKVIKYGSAK
jgi:hypothetical protein